MSKPSDSARAILLSTLGVVVVAMCLVAAGDYNGYEGPVALETMAEHNTVSGSPCLGRDMNTGMCVCGPAADVLSESVSGVT
jgi:hypothetical protein